MRYGSIELSIKCPKCDHPVYPQGPQTKVHCGHCQADTAVPQEYWLQFVQGLWDAIANGSLREGQGQRGHLIGFFNTAFAYFQEKPVCAQCQTELELDPQTDRPCTHECPQCKARTTLEPVPPWIQSAVPAARLLVGVAIGEEGPEATVQAEISGPVALTCPGCAGSLVVDGVERLVQCEYCGMNVYLPDDLWLRLHPAKTKRRWGVLFTLSGDASAEERARPDALQQQTTGMVDAWPYRGLSVDGRRGVDSGILPTGEVLWRARIGMRGDAAQFAVAGGRLFIGSAGKTEDESDAEDGLYCCDCETGERIWRFATRGLRKGAEDSGCDSGVVVGYDHAYFGCKDQVLYCVDARTGKLAWKREFEYDLDSPPSLAHERVFLCGPDDQLYCFVPDTGEVIWSIAYSLDGYHPPLILGDRLYFASSDPHLQCVDAFTGMHIWSVGLPDSVECDLVAIDKRVLFRTDSNRVYCLSLEDGRLLWEHESKQDIQTELTCAPGRVCFGTEDRMRCLSLETGEQLWAKKVESGIYSAAGYADDRVYFGEYGDKLYCLDARSGRTLWKTKLDDMDETAVVVVDGRIYLHGEKGDFFCLK